MTKVISKEEDLIKFLINWYEQDINYPDHKEGASVNYHWGEHSGMVGMARTVLESMYAIKRKEFNNDWRELND